jgi:RNA polymerase sigma-70 factor, ECF subfamily
MLRSLEGLSVSETADALGLSHVNVRVRLTRAHALIRKTVRESFKCDENSPFTFAGVRCNRTVVIVFTRIGARPPQRLSDSGQPT